MNMDPANDPGDLYETIFDVRHDMVDLSVVMVEMELGPNGKLMFCMEYMEQDTLTATRKSLTEFNLPPCGWIALYAGDPFRALNLKSTRRKAV